MSRKPRFKVQRKNDYLQVTTAEFGRKQWLPVWDDYGRLGYSLTQLEADRLYWEMVGYYPDVTYRIVEKR